MELVKILITVSASSILVILGVLYLDNLTRKNRKSKEEILPIENHEVSEPTIHPELLTPKSEVVEVLEPTKETIAPALKPKHKTKHKNIKK